MQEHWQDEQEAVQVFGCAGDQLTRYMYSMASGEGGAQLNNLLDLAKQEVGSSCLCNTSSPPISSFFSSFSSCSSGQPGAQPHHDGQAGSLW